MILETSNGAKSLQSILDNVSTSDQSHNWQFVSSLYSIFINFLKNLKYNTIIQYNWHLATRLNKTNVLHEGEST